MSTDALIPTAMPAVLPTGSLSPDFLSTPDFHQRMHKMSVENYHRLRDQGIIAENTELIRGIVIEKMGQSPLHCYIVQILVDWLTENLKAKGWTIREAKPVTTEDSEPEPDVCVIKGKPADFLKSHPRTSPLAIEAAVTSEKLDREKVAIYAEAEIQEYWIVFAEQGYVEVYSNPVKGKYQEFKTLRPGEMLKPVVFTELEFPVAELFPETE